MESLLIGMADLVCSTENIKFKYKYTTILIDFLAIFTSVYISLYYCHSKLIRTLSLNKIIANFVHEII